jgi:hypothetical protein
MSSYRSLHFPFTYRELRPLCDVLARVPVRSRISTSPNLSDPLWDPLNHLANENEGISFSGVKRPGCEADCSPATSAWVKKSESVRIHAPHKP